MFSLTTHFYHVGDRQYWYNLCFWKRNNLIYILKRKSYNFLIIVSSWSLSQSFENILHFDMKNNIRVFYLLRYGA